MKVKRQNLRNTYLHFGGIIFILRKNNISEMGEGKIESEESPREGENVDDENDADSGVDQDLDGKYCVHS